MNNLEYDAEIKSIATNLVGEAMAQTDSREDAEEFINDGLLHETIDGHQWVIYYSYNMEADVQEELENAFDVYEAIEQRAASEG